LSIGSPCSESHHVYQSANANTGSAARFSAGAVTRASAITTAMQASIFRVDLPLLRVNPRSPGRMAAAVTCAVRSGVAVVHDLPGDDHLQRGPARRAVPCQNLDATRTTCRFALQQGQAMIMQWPYACST
jgi:hypothetical protein